MDNIINGIIKYLNSINGRGIKLKQVHTEYINIQRLLFPLSMKLID